MNKRILVIVILTVAVLCVAVFIPPMVWSQTSNTQPNSQATVPISTAPGTEYVYAQGGYVILNLPPSSLYNKTNLRIGFMTSYANSTKGAENILDVRVWVPETSRYSAIAYINTNPVAVTSLAKMYAGVPSFMPILVNSDDLKIWTQDDYTVVNLTKPVNVQWGDPNPQSIKNLNFTIPPMTFYFQTTGSVYQQTVANSTLPSGWNSTTTTWSAPGWASVSIPSWIGSAIPCAAIMMPALYLVATRPLDIVETAQASGSFNTLLTALAAANLTDALKGTGPFTVFAPTDAAFNELPPGVLDALLANTTALTQVLLYHVAAGKLMASDVVNLANVTTLQGGTLPISTNAGVVKIGPATITKTDIVCSNGVIHVIDKVLIPPGIMNIVQTAQYYNFSTLVTAVTTAGLDSTLAGNGPFTVFAPTDAAFAALPAGTLNSLLANKTALTNILLYHVVSGKLTQSDLTSYTSLTTLQGEKIAISSSASGVKVNDATIIATVVCSNGVINVIDKVLIPA